MAIREKVYEGKTFYEVSLKLRSKTIPGLSVQKMRSKIKTLKEAQMAEREILRDCAAELATREGLGITWSILVDRWDNAQLNKPVGFKELQKNTI